MIETVPYQDVLKSVENWSPKWRLALIHDLLRTLESELPSTPPKRDTLSRALGLLATDETAPSDAEVQRWLDERRMGKFN